MDRVCLTGDTSQEFFRRLCRDEQTGLNQSSLHIRQLAESALPIRAPKLFRGIAYKTLHIKDNLQDLENGLEALNNDDMRQIRDYMLEPITEAVSSTLKALRQDFSAAFVLNSHWYNEARELVEYRDMLRGYTWLAPPGMISLRDELSERSLKALAQLYSALSSALSSTLSIALSSTAEELRTSVNVYVCSVVINGGHFSEIHDNDRQALIQAMHYLWMVDSPQCASVRYAALALAKIVEIPALHRKTCINALDDMSNENVASLTTAIRLQNLDNLDFALCRDFVQSCATAVKMDPTSAVSWQAVAQYVLGLHGIASHCGHPYMDGSFLQYYYWMKDLSHIYGDTVPALVDSATWIRRLLPFASAVQALENIPNSTRAIRCIYDAFREAKVMAAVEVMLDTLVNTRKQTRLSALHRVAIGFIDEKYADPVSRAVQELSQASDDDFLLCQSLVMLAESKSLYVAAIQLEVILRRPCVNRVSVNLLRSLAEALHFPSSSDFRDAHDHFLQLIAEKKREARNLEGLHMKLRRADGSAAMAVMRRLNIEVNITPIEDEIAAFPEELTDQVEQIDDSTVKLHLPTAHLNKMQKTALGLQNDDSTILHLRMNSNHVWVGFCVHVLKAGADSQAIEHRPCRLISPEFRGSLCGDETNYLAEAISLRLWELLWQLRELAASLYHIYQVAKSLLDNIGLECPHCRLALGASFYRPTICDRTSCRAKQTKSVVNWQTDADVIRLLPASVAAAAASMTSSTGSGNNNWELLPKCPIELDNPKKLLHLMRTVPSFLDNKRAYLDSLSIPRIRTLINYTCTMLGGYIMEAQGSWRNPNLPNVLQYVVVDTPLAVTTAFAQHDHLQPRKVLFHGTSIDRLPGILANGLKVLSHTPMMTHAAAHGSGIYLAEQPSMSLGYAKATRLADAPNLNIDFAKHLSKELLLGVEYAGNVASRGSGIYVATDPTKILLRYIFLVPSGYAAPVANHLIPAMLSNFNSLRSGLKRSRRG